MGKVICFGEIMGRLCPDGYLKIVQANKLNLTFAGGEANVAVSLANYGTDAAFITKLPDNDIGKSVVRTLRSYAVDLTGVVFGGERLGMYYVEKGASQRPSKVIYDRKYSSISMADRCDFNWEQIFDGAQWFHFTGITPALSEGMPQICEDACIAAKKAGVTISYDINYRKNLWSRQQANETMTKLMRYVDVCIANEEDANDVFGIKAEGSNITGGSLKHEGYISVAQQIQQKFGCTSVAITLRESISASDNNWAAMLYTGGKSYFSKKYAIHLVDRVGGGDSFAGALIYTQLKGFEPQDAIEFAVAGSCLKQTVEGDFNQATIEDINRLAQGDGSGRVQR